MAGDKRWKTPDMKMRVRLAKAQEQLWRAQAKRTRTMTRGEIDVEDARRKAARQLAKATEKVERRAAKVAELEAMLPSAYRTRRATEPDNPPFHPAQAPNGSNVARDFSMDPIIVRHDTTTLDQPTPADDDESTQ